MITTYDKALAIARKELLAKKNLTIFCKHIGINYNYALRIKNENCDKPYPDIVAKILENFGYKVEKLTYFNLEKNINASNK